jgi:hypothetical protein
LSQTEKGSNHTFAQNCRRQKSGKGVTHSISSLYLKEKALEEEFPGIGFRDSVGGREAISVNLPPFRFKRVLT